MYSLEVIKVRNAHAAGRECQDAIERGDWREANRIKREQDYATRSETGQGIISLVKAFFQGTRA